MPHDAVGDPRFFARTGPHALHAVAEAGGVRLVDPAASAAALFHGVAPLQGAGPAEISFLDNPRYAGQLAASRAGAIILQAEFVDRLPRGCIALVTPEPYLAWAHVCALFYPRPAVQSGRHPTAVVDPTAQVDPAAQIGAYVVISAGVVIGAGCRIDAHAVIAEGVVMGAECVVGSHASVSHALLGERVRLLPGARIGQRGFGFAPDGTGGYVSIPQLGRVVLGDDVEIGANATIDRGSMRDTVIAAGARLDNLVQIGHNVRLGRGCVIVAQAGISGSTTLEDHVMVGGQAGLTGHLQIGHAARIGAQSGVMADVPAGESVMGSPCQPSRRYFRELATLRRLASATVAAGRVAGRDAPGRG